MTKLETLLNKHKNAQDATTSAAKELQEYQNAILKGDETTGDPMNDFLVINGQLDDASQVRVSALTKKIANAAGEPILVKSDFSYVYDTVGCHGFGAKPEYENGSSGALRLGIIRSPVWTKEGLVLASKYAHQSSQYHTYELGFPENWDGERLPLLLGAAELFDNIYAWPQPHSPVERTDIAKSIRETLREGVFDYKSERERMTTKILIGDEVKEEFRLTLRDDRGKSSYDNAIFAFKHGVSRDAYRKSRAENRALRQKDLFAQIADLSMKGEVPRKMLRDAVRLGLHKTSLQHHYGRGIVIGAKLFLEDLYQRNGISE